MGMIEIAEKFNVSINKSSLKDDALLKIAAKNTLPSIRSIDLGKQDLSYPIQLIEDEAEPFEQLQLKNKWLDESQKIQDLVRDRSH